MEEGTPEVGCQEEDPSEWHRTASESELSGWLLRWTERSERKSPTQASAFSAPQAFLLQRRTHAQMLGQHRLLFLLAREGTALSPQCDQSLDSQGISLETYRVIRHVALLRTLDT